MEKYNKYNIQAAHNILNGKYHFSKKYSIIALNQNIPALYYVLKGSGTYTLTDYDFLSISTDTYKNNNGRIYKFSITTTNFYVVENIGKKYYGEYYIWYYSPDVSWSIGSSYSIK